ncbi:MAG TPA: SDR family NAD(P)-dependent oxidoreductase, partial [Thermomicrobiales bacterium]|nr:SDR family NAD(P)-dependent oxidoreductase [Thermomicrobiales bacterium]
IARRLAARLAQRGCNLILAGQDADDLLRSAADLRLRFGVRTATAALDATDFESHREFFARCTRTFANGLSGVVFCVGWMADPRAETDFVAIRRMIDVNYASAVSLLNLAGDYFQDRREGWICALSSVAGDRGRQSNYSYGSTKAALSTYLQGLRNRLSPFGIAVTTVKPGCVDTAMTYGLTSLPLLASPEQVAADIDRGIRRRRSVVYTPRIWRPIMAAIRLIPEPVFQRMKL